MDKNKFKQEGGVFYTPAIRNFQDTGYVKHCFQNGSEIMARVVPSKNDSAGFEIELIITADGSTVANVQLGRFEALCLVDVLTKNLLNQEELVDLQIQELNRSK